MKYANVYRIDRTYHPEKGWYKTGELVHSEALPSETSAADRRLWELEVEYPNTGAGDDAFYRPGFVPPVENFWILPENEPGKPHLNTYYEED